MIRLVRYVRIPRDVHRRKITRKAVLARDAYTCQYCGHEATGLTVDHVIPRSRGGESVWENIVASCAPCNRKKGNRMPREAACTPRRARGRRARPSSSGSPRPGSRWPGSRTCSGPAALCADRPSAKRRAAPIGAALPRCDFGRVSDSRPGGTHSGLRGPPVPGVGFRQAARTLPVRIGGHPPVGRSGRLAAPHLQRPEKTVTQRSDHLLSLVDPIEADARSGSGRSKLGVDVRGFPRCRDRPPAMNIRRRDRSHVTENTDAGRFEHEPERDGSRSAERDGARALEGSRRRLVEIGVFAALLGRRAVRVPGPRRAARPARRRRPAR